MLNFNNTIHYPNDLTDYDALAMLLPGRTIDDVATSTIPKRGMFLLHATNSRKRGKSQYARTIDCEGALFSNGHVVLDTYELSVCSFRSLSQMEDYIKNWGSYTISWLDRGDA
jgi:hypothetical protein